MSATGSDPGESHPAGGPSPAGAPAQAAQAADTGAGGESGAAGSATPASGQGAAQQEARTQAARETAAAKGPLSRAERALERARARMNGSAPKAAATAATGTGPDAQAGATRAAATDAAPGTAGHEQVDGAPAPGQAGDGTGADGAADASATGEAAAGAGASPDGTATPPQDWPREWQERFGALPEDARGLVLSMNREMTAGLQRGLSQIATLRKGHEALLGAVEAAQAEPGEVVELVDLARRFKESPREVLTQLAGQAGLEVFFDASEAAGEVPEFKDAKELASWLKNEALKTLRTEQARANQQAATAAEQERTRAAVKAEFDAAAGKYPDFRAHFPAVAEKLAANPALGVEDAYWLARVPALVKSAERAGQLERELAAARAAQEAERKARTQLPSGGNGRAAPPADDTLSPAQRAMARAQRRLAAQA